MNAIASILHRKQRSASPTHSGGFTLVELIVAMTVGAILIGFTTMLLRTPVEAYVDQSERALVNEATDTVSDQLDLDLRSALPNSVRIRNAGTRSIVEFIQYDGVGFFRQNGELGAPNRELQFSTPGDTFSIFGRLLPKQSAPYSVSRLAVGNRGTAGRNAYQGTNVITPANVSIQITRSPQNEETVVLPAGFGFATPLPMPVPAANRVFSIAGPVTYICNSATGFVRRYSGYPITANIPTTEGSAQLATAEVRVLASNASTCRIRCDAAGTPNVSVCLKQLVTEISLTRATSSGNESIRLLHQATLDNQWL